MNHEMRLTPFPGKALATGNRNPEVSDTDAPSWPSAIPAPRPPVREPKRHTGESPGQGRDRLLTVEEFADELRVTKACVRKWIVERKVVVVKVGRLVRLPTSELRRIVDEGTRPRVHMP